MGQRGSYGYELGQVLDRVGAHSLPADLFMADPFAKTRSYPTSPMKESSGGGDSGLRAKNPREP